MSGERWRTVVGASRYEVSDLGRVRSFARSRPRLLTPSPNNQGYLLLQLSTDAKEVRRAKVHHLVLEAFVGPAAPGQLTRHLDGDRRNNELANLRWGTKSENERDKVRHGDCFNAAKTHCPQGHPYDAANTLIRPKGWRACRICTRAMQRAYKARQRALRAAAKGSAA